MTTAAPSQASARRRLVLCPPEAPRLLPRDRFLRHCANLPPSAPDFVTAMGVLTQWHRQRWRVAILKCARTNLRAASLWVSRHQRVRGLTLQDTPRLDITRGSAPRCDSSPLRHKCCILSYFRAPMRSGTMPSHSKQVTYK
jgi:hypothetical protein